MCPFVLACEPLFGCCLAAPVKPRTHEHAGCLCVVGGWVGCGPYSGRSRLLLVLTPPFVPRAVLRRARGRVVCLGVLLFVLAY